MPPCNFGNVVSLQRTVNLWKSSCNVRYATAIECFPLEIIIKARGNRKWRYVGSVQYPFLDHDFGLNRFRGRFDQVFHV